MDPEALWQISKSIENEKLRTYHWDFGQLGGYIYQMGTTLIQDKALVEKKVSWQADFKSDTRK